MRSGVSFPAYSPVFTLASGTANADYPVANLADLVNIRAVFKATGAVVVTFDLGSTVSVGIVALVHHNAAGATWRVQLYSDAGMTAQVADSGTVTLNTPNHFPAVTPYCPTPVSARAGKITLASGSWSVGGVAVAGFWSFTDVQNNREIGVTGNDQVQPLLGADHTTKVFSPRTLSASRGVGDVADQDTAMDFIAEKKGNPFVWVWDADDATTWARECWLAKQVDPAPFVKLAHPSGQVSFKLVEHLG